MEETKMDEIKEKPEAQSGVRKGLRKAWDAFTTLITVALLALAIYCIVGVANQNKTGELFFPFGYRPVVILSGSMEGAIQTGAVVIVKETKEVEEEDVIFFFDEDGIPTIHRYVGTNHNGDYVTKGDANPKEDYDPVTPQQVQGKVVVVMNWLSGIFGLFV